MARTATLAQMHTIAADDGVKAYGLLAVVAILADVINDQATPAPVLAFAKASSLAPEQYVAPLARAIAVDEGVQAKVIVAGRLQLDLLEDADIYRVALRCFQVMAPTPPAA